MKIYIASSWRNQHAVEMLTDLLRAQDHEVLSFVERAVETEGRSDLQFDVDAWIASEDGERKFEFDTGSAATCDLLIYIGPSGTDAWAEVGVAWAKGRPIVGLWAKGEPAGLMRRMVAWCEDFREIVSQVGEYDKERRNP